MGKHRAICAFKRNGSITCNCPWCRKYRHPKPFHRMTRTERLKAIHEGKIDSFAKPLALALGERQLDVVKCLIEHKADVNEKSTHLWQTPLLWAVTNSNAETVQVLLDAKADTEYRSPYYNVLNAATHNDKFAAGIRKLLFAPMFHHLSVDVGRWLLSNRDWFMFVQNSQWQFRETSTTTLIEFIPIKDLVFVVLDYVIQSLPFFMGFFEEEEEEEEK